MPVLKIKNNGVWEELSGGTSGANIEVDTTLTQPDMAADSKTVGDAITDLNDSIKDFSADIAELNTLIGDASVEEQIASAVSVIDGGDNWGQEV